MTGASMFAPMFASLSTPTDFRASPYLSRLRMSGPSKVLDLGYPSLARGAGAGSLNLLAAAALPAKLYPPVVLPVQTTLQYDFYFVVSFVTRLYWDGVAGEYIIRI